MVNGSVRSRFKNTPRSLRRGLILVSLGYLSITLCKNADTLDYLKSHHPEIVAEDNSLNQAPIEAAELSEAY
jgi:hypothetical protein